MIFNIILITAYLIVGIYLGYTIQSYLSYLKNLKKDKIKITFEKEPEKKKELYDIVYILKNDIPDKPGELTYSLRSLQNFTYRKVWFVGGQPSGLEPDGRIEVEQYGKTPYQKVYNSLKAVCENEEITENFYLFNDDFFILHKMDKFEPMRDYSIHKLILDLNQKPKGNKNYVKELNITLGILRNNNLSYWNYGTHTPFLLNKKNLRIMFEKFPRPGLFRTIYGNYFHVGGFTHEDCKIGWNMKMVPYDDWPVVSTSEKSFINGEVGKYIREKFPEKSRFEID